MHNPLLQIIRNLLCQHPQGIDEFSILKTVENHAVFAELGDTGQLPLFHKHFTIMNALYQLQQQLWQERQQVLEITPLINKLHPKSLSSASTQLIQAESVGPAEYYLNWDNFHNTGEDDVARLYQSFWQYLAFEKQQPAALKTLQFDAQEQPSRTDIDRRYRQLAKQHHPDMGGNAAHFIGVRAAYEVLRKKS